MSHFASALLIQPDFPDALNGLSWILATSPNQNFRNGPEAVRMAERAWQLTSHKDAQSLKTLAAAYAEVGRFNDAVLTIQAAISTAGGLSDGPQMLDAFRASQPWRAPMLK
jgi:Flp pilus assembly protein TadD